MHRTIWSALCLSLTSLFPYASADFGFTSASFANAQLSTPIAISWNGQSGNIELRLMVYPADQQLDYLPIASDLSGNTYSWLPTALAPGSVWTLEGIDEEGNLATSGASFTIQGTVASNSDPGPTSYLQQNPKSATQPTTLQTSAATSAAAQTTAAQTTDTGNYPTGNSPEGNSPQSQNDSIPRNIKYAILFVVVVGFLGITSLATFFILRYRQKKGKSLLWRPRQQKRSSTPPQFELHANDSMESLHKPMELEGSKIEGTSETSSGSRVELGWNAGARHAVEKRISMASGAVETSMGNRVELA